MSRVDPGRVAAGVFWGAALLALGIWARPRIESAIRLARLVSAAPPTVLTVPVRGVAASDLRDTWGDSRSGGRTHQGIDIFARRRTPVVSATEGVLVRRGENQLGGRTVTVMGPGGERHYYAHLDRYGGQGVGDWVAAGEVLGFVGTTGNAPAEAPHLHYAIYAEGGAINPFPRLTGERGATMAGD